MLGLDLGLNAMLAHRERKAANTAEVAMRPLLSRLTGANGQPTLVHVVASYRFAAEKS